jgi:predicted metal-dependent phosphoesterase TrpH
MPKIDHHLHTTRYSPDSQIEPHELIERAIELGLDGVVITEHDELWPAEELAGLQPQGRPFFALSGVEVSAREGHFLVYGLTDLDEVGPGVRLADLLRVVEAQRAAIVAAHPFRWEQDFDQILSEHGPVFHGLELVSKNVTRDTRRKTEGLLRRFKSIGATGSSDAHELETIGCYFTEFDAPIASMADFVAALRSGRFRPRHHTSSHLACGPVA